MAVVKGLDGTMLCVLASLLFLVFSAIGIGGAFLYGVFYETSPPKIALEAE